MMLMDRPVPYKNNLCPVKIISPKKDKSCFFGYYDLKAYDDTDRYHLCNMANFEDRLQTADDVLELGVIDLDNGNFEKIDETKSWNFQRAQCFSGQDAKRMLFSITYMKTANI